MISKGRISSVSADGRTAAVIPAFCGEIVTNSLAVAYHLRGALQIGAEVVYCLFPDGTGTILARMDGEANTVEIVRAVVEEIQPVLDDLDERISNIESGGGGTPDTTAKLGMAKLGTMKLGED